MCDIGVPLLKCVASNWMFWRWTFRLVGRGAWWWVPRLGRLTVDRGMLKGPVPYWSGDKLFEVVFCIYVTKYYTCPIALSNLSTCKSISPPNTICSLNIKLQIVINISNLQMMGWNLFFIDQFSAIQQMSFYIKNIQFIEYAFWQIVPCNDTLFKWFR